MKLTRFEVSNCEDPHTGIIHGVSEVFNNDLMYQPNTDYDTYSELLNCLWLMDDEESEFYLPIPPYMTLSSTIDNQLLAFFTDVVLQRCKPIIDKAYKLLELSKHKIVTIEIDANDPHIVYQDQWQALVYTSDVEKLLRGE